jgi:hypothetical protein
MATQTYANHTQFSRPFHFVLLPILFLTLIGSAVNLSKSLDDHERLYSAALIAVLSACMLFVAVMARVFALRAQDRAIRAEENLRHLVIAGKLLDPRLGTKQVVALRFAPDAEFPALAQRAADTAMAPDAIKRAVKSWRADTYRV